MTRASISTDGCSSSEPKKKSHSVSFAGKANKVNNMPILRFKTYVASLFFSGLDSGTGSLSIFQVYEDKDMGILCYTDENGELVCEGLDEGPRLTWQDMEK